MGSTTNCWPKKEEEEVQDNEAEAERRGCERACQTGRTSEAGEGLSTAVWAYPPMRKQQHTPSAHNGACHAVDGRKEE